MWPLRGDEGVGPTGRVIANIRNQKYVKPLTPRCTRYEIVMVDAQKPVEMRGDAVLKANGGKEVDIVSTA